MAGVRFFVDGVEVEQAEYIAIHEDKYGVPPQDIGTSGVLHIGDLPEDMKQ
jgi:hypothetical protein